MWATTKKSHEKLIARWGMGRGGSTLTVSLTVKYAFFYELPKVIWEYFCFKIHELSFLLREKYTLGEESIIFYVWSHAQSKVYNVKITKPKVKRRLRTRSPLRQYPATCSCDAGKGTKLRKRNLLSCKHITVV